MRCTSILSCGLVPLWEALVPRVRQRRANREAQVEAVATPAAAAAAQRNRRDKAPAGDGQPDRFEPPAGPDGPPPPGTVEVRFAGPPRP